MRRIVLDLVQVAGLVVGAAGAGAQFGWPAGLMALGFGLVALTVVDVLALRHG